jgi:protein phosphatase
MLTQAIQQANQALVNHRQTADSDLGSTVTATLIIGDVATITNVGDSRTYLLRDGRLEQITQDHSLVARLVDAGVIKPEDVHSHPQRNQIYRCLGHKSDVEVDTFTHKLQAGDVLVLCSDGLWEMVLDDEIQRIIETTRSPQKACDALIEAANRAGGKDNIAAIVVEME